jgi:hypothetical protein
MRLRLPRALRKIADWDLRLEILAIVAIFLGGLALIVVERCTTRADAAAGPPRISGSSTEALADVDSGATR